MIVLGIAGTLILLSGIAGAVVVGIIENNAESLWLLIPLLCVFIPGMVAAILGFALSFSYGYNHRIAKTLFTEDEIKHIDTPIFLNIAIAEKAKKLLAEGKAKGDMSAYEEFRELAMLSRGSGTHGRYNTF